VQAGVAGLPPKSANRTGDGLRKLAREMAAAHVAADAAEDELFGAGRRGDEVPEEAWSPRRRDERIAAALADLEADRRAAQAAEEAKAEAFRERQRAGRRTGPAPRQAAAELAEENLARVRAARAARLAELEERRASGEPRRGNAAGVDDYCRVREAAAKVEKARARAEAAERRATAAMRERLKTEDGIAAYRQRGHIAETPHGHIKHNMGFRQLSVRGKTKASAEWTFACAVCNLFKALTTGHLTRQALAALTS
jgi:hypothetical protein